MSRLLPKVAAVLALIIGGMAVVAGGRVLLGSDPGYYVIDWLPIYNFIAGALTVLIAAPLIWRGSRYALPIALAVFGAHAVVMILLQTAYRDVVARDSVVAMTVRLTVWALILVLLFLQRRKTRSIT